MASGLFKYFMFKLAINCFVSALSQASQIAKLRVNLLVIKILLELTGYLYELTGYLYGVFPA